jgi:hypothetical protein
MKKYFSILTLSIVLSAIFLSSFAEAEEYTDLYNPDKCTTSEYVDVELSGYSVYEGKAYYGYCMIYGMDPKTIKPLIINGEKSLSYGQDKNNVYYQTRILKELIPNKFKIKNIGRYGVILYDNNTVYFDGTDITDVNPDLETLKATGDFYYRDKNFLYHQILTDKTPNDIQNFSFIKVAGGDQNNFETGYKITKDAVYWYGKKIEGADPGSFEVVECDYSSKTAKDKNNVYWSGKLAYGIDSKSFTSLASNCYDKNAVYDTSNNMKMLSTFNKLKRDYGAENRSKLVDQTLSAAIKTYETKYPNYTPQPAVPAPGSPEEAELKKFQEEIAKAQQEETDANKQDMMKKGIWAIGILAVGGIGYIAIKKRNKRKK